MELVASWMECTAKGVLKMESIAQNRKMEELKIVSHVAECPQMHEADGELDLE